MTVASLITGEKIEVRTIEPADKDGLRAFHEHLSASTQRRRFFTPHPHLSEEELARFTEIDHTDRQAYVALLEATIVGVGRYDRTGPDEAEVAFVVSDEWQGHGIATLLLDQLARHACAVGITRFAADTLADNAAMLRVFRHWAGTYRRTFDHGIAHVDMTFPASVMA